MITTEHKLILRMLGLSLILVCVLLSATSCGKRGDPYRPSEIPTNTSSDS